MAYLAIGIVFLQMFTSSLQREVQYLQETLVPTSDPMDVHMESRIGILQEYMQQKIMEQNRALGVLLQLSRTNQILTNKLIHYCHKEIPKTRDKMEIFLPSRRSNSDYGQIMDKEDSGKRVKAGSKQEDTPIISMVKFRNSFPKLGNLFVHVLSNEFSPFDVTEVNSQTDSSTDSPE